MIRSSSTRQSSVHPAQASCGICACGWDRLFHRSVLPFQTNLRDGYKIRQLQLSEMAPLLLPRMWRYAWKRQKTKKPCKSSERKID